MAAIVQPHRLPATVTAPRPDLRLVQGGRARPARPAPAGVSPAAVLAALALVLVVMVGAVAVGRGALAGLAPAPAGAGAPAAAAADGPTVTVRAGDTLWSIARRIQPTGDVRALVDELAAAHGGTAITPGYVLTVPR